MSTEDTAQAREVVKGYALATAAPLVLWGVILTIGAPAIVALAWATGDPGNPFTGSPASPNPLFMLLAVLAGIGAAITLTVGCWRAAKNSDYVAAATYVRVIHERDLLRAAREQESTEAGTSPH